MAGLKFTLTRKLFSSAPLRSEPLRSEPFRSEPLRSEPLSAASGALWKARGASSSSGMGAAQADRNRAPASQKRVEYERMELLRGNGRRGGMGTAADALVP